MEEHQSCHGDVGFENCREAKWRDEKTEVGRSGTENKEASSLREDLWGENFLTHGLNDFP